MLRRVALLIGLVASTVGFGSAQAGPGLDIGITSWTHNAHVPGSTTSAMERDEWGLWRAKLASNDIIGEGGVMPPPPSTYLLNDEFTTFDSTRWARRWWWNGDDYATQGSVPEHQLYRNANVSVSNGILSLTAKRQATSDFMGRPRSWTSGMISSGGIQGVQAAGFTFTYGHVEARIRMPAGQGFWPAFWLCNAVYSHRCNHEIDVMEWIGQTPNTSYMNYHYLGSNLSSGAWKASAPLSDDFHVYALDWRPGSLVWLIDGIERQRFESVVQVSNQPHYLILNLQVGGSWSGLPGDATPSPAAMEIDYVRVS